MATKMTELTIKCEVVPQWQTCLVEGWQTDSQQAAVVAGLQQHRWQHQPCHRPLSMVQ